MPLTPAEQRIQTYLNIDALQLKRSLALRLATEDRNITDQFFAGSNINALLDTLAYTYENLIFYLSQTAADLSFTGTQQYHHINRLAKLVNYNPRGPVAAFSDYTLKFEPKTSVNNGIYIVPRYSYVELETGEWYSLAEDIICTIKDQQIVSVSWSNGEPVLQLAYEGKYFEYPIQTASGEVFEKIVLNTPNKPDVFYSYDHIDVYVKSSTTNNKWVQFYRVQDIYTTSSTFPGYTVRFNEYGRIEIQFGNGITGKILQPGDQIAIYALVSNRNAKILPPRSLNKKPLVYFNSLLFQNILTNLGIITNTSEIFSLSNPLLKSLYLVNNYPTNKPLKPETVKNIKENIPLALQAHSKCSTLTDYIYKMTTIASSMNIDFLILDTKTLVSSFHSIFNNNEIAKEYFKQFLNIHQYYQARVINEGIYIFVISKNSNSPLLPATQKIHIQNQIEKVKNFAHTIYILDPLIFPVYFGLLPRNQFTELILEKIPGADINDANLAEQTSNILNQHLNWKNQSIGNEIDTEKIEEQILNIPGIKNVYTKTEENLKKGLWFAIDFQNEPKITNKMLSIPFGVYYFHEIENIKKKITISSQPLID